MHLVPSRRGRGDRARRQLTDDGGQRRGDRGQRLHLLVIPPHDEQRDEYEQKGRTPTEQGSEVGAHKRTIDVRDGYVTPP
ncbi:hypothetical protein NBRGN_071_00290 [Nocardia brasiliensis NBRC 14402]|nr:hypothetical protein NBRGN_071_00290 [Nocardia brasiliensis NBRC 14402]